MHPVAARLRRVVGRRRGRRARLRVARRAQRLRAAPLRRCRCCPPGTGRCGCCTSRDLHLMPATAPQGRVGARPGRRSSPTSSSTPATTSRTRTPSRRCSTRSSAARGRARACSSSARTTTSRPQPKNPVRYLHHGRRPTTVGSIAAAADRATSSRASLDARLGRPDQPRATLDGRAAAPSSSSGSTTRTSSYDRYDQVARRRLDPTPTCTIGRHPRALPAGPRRDDRRRRRARRRRSHARRPALRALLRRAGDQLRPRPRPRQGASPAGGRAPDARRRPRPRRTPRGCEVSAGLGTSPYAPVRFACRPEATLLTLVPAAPVGRRPVRARDPIRSRWAPARLASLLAASRSQIGGRCSHGVWRSLVARFVRDEEAAGSNPVTPTRRLCRSEVQYRRHVGENPRSRRPAAGVAHHRVSVTAGGSPGRSHRPEPPRWGRAGSPAPRWRRRTGS